MYPRGYRPFPGTRGCVLDLEAFSQQVNSSQDLLNLFVSHFAEGITAVDARHPQAVNVRSKKPFQPGIGPHSESRTVELVAKEMVGQFPDAYSGKIGIGVPYPDVPQQKCDLCLGVAPIWEWAIEVKMLRMLGDNGKLNDNMLMHILSPYPEHRSALTDCHKLQYSHIAGKKAVVIYGYDHDEWPLLPAIDAFERLATASVYMGPRVTANFASLVHPVHSKGSVFGWSVEQVRAPA
jgi:hypothetical protein